ncbi:mCG148011 [Mus musculus]|nr:mCG148011 [Mus musculus]
MLKYLLSPHHKGCLASTRDSSASRSIMWVTLHPMTGKSLKIRRKLKHIHVHHPFFSLGVSWN